MGRRRMYDWDLWLDGEEHRLWEGRHFHVQPESFRQQVINEAKRRGLSIETTMRRNEAGTAVLRVRRAGSHDVQTMRNWPAIFRRRRPVVLEKGRDFTCSVTSMRATVYQAAKRHGVKVRTSADQTSVTIFPQSDDWMKEQVDA